MTNKTSILSFTLLAFILNFPSVKAQQGEWTWMKGSSSPGSTGSFGVKGVSSPTNNPPALYGPALWLDSLNNIWLFGGVYYNTLWKYSIATNEWTWINGSSINSYPGTYGTQGVPSPTNSPGARAYGFPSWKDEAGDFWIYGGYGYDAFGNEGLLNDLWRYSYATNEWTWMHGTNSALPSAPPDYGTFQVPSPTNTPGAREETTVSWVDSVGNLWFFGGFDNNITLKDDIWKYDVSLNQWAWMAGTQGSNLMPDFGSLGVPSPSNTPGGRNGYCKWIDDDGNLWLFGGGQLLTSSADLWKFDMTTLEWTWLSGTDVLNSSGNNSGASCVSDSAFFPSSRFENRACWKDGCGNFWMFGGVSLVTGFGYNNDMWVYRPLENDWTWASGTLATNNAGSYGTQGVSSPTNIPPSRYGAPGVYDESGNLWLFGGKITGSVDGNDLWKFVPDTTCPATANCNVLQAPSFAASDTDVCEKFCIDFTDQSSNNPTSWLWLFPGGTPSSSTDQNPQQICYQNPGVFDVTLITTNSSGNDTLTFPGYITVYPTPAFPTITQNGDTLTSSPAVNYQWQFNSIDISGATNQSYVVTQTGFYTIVVGDSNGCKNSTTLFIEFTEIENLISDAQFSIYPNPNEGSFTVELNMRSIVEWIRLSVTNTLGREIFVSEERNLIQPWKKTIDLQNASAGVYFIEIEMVDGFVRKKVVVGQ